MSTFLSGLCRTCEIFGVSEYVMGNMKFLNDRNFETLSVTAQKWLPITEVRVTQLSKVFDKSSNLEFKLICGYS